MELTLLLRRRTGGNDAELTTPKPEARARKHFSVAVGDHPCIERGMKIAHVIAEQVVGPAVNHRTGSFAISLPFGGTTG